MLTPAERNLAKQHLVQSEQAAAKGLKHIALQDRIVVTLRKGNHCNTELAEALLTTMLETQLLHEAHRDRLRRELGLE